MTNEEKALQIKDDEKAEMIAYCLSHPLRCERCGAYIWEAKDSADTAFKAAMKMAKWKDEQLAKEKQALIDKACEWLKENVSKHCHGYYTFHKGLMLEEFQQAMKGGEYENDKI